MSELQKWASAKYAFIVGCGESVDSWGTVNLWTSTTSISTNSCLSYTSATSPCGNAQWSDVIPTRSLNQWQIQGIKRLKEVFLLRENWDSYGSRPPTEEAANAAIDLITGVDLDYFVAPRVVPVSGGGIQLEWEINARSLELEIFDDGTIEYLRTENGRPLDEGHIHRIEEVQPLFLWLLSSQSVQVAA